MSQKSHVASLMRDLGPVLGEVQITEFEEDGIWSVVFTDETTVFVDWAEEESSLVISVDVGSPAPEAQDKVYALLLQYNSQWRQLGALWASIDEPGGTVSLHYTRPAADLALPTLSDVVLNLRDLSQMWRKIINEGAENQESLPAELAPSEASGAIRV